MVKLIVNNSLFWYFSFAVSDELVAEQLDSLTLAEAIELKRLFIVNHSILDGIYDSNCNQNVGNFVHFFNQDL